MLATLTVLTITNKRKERKQINQGKFTFGIKHASPMQRIGLVGFSVLQKAKDQRQNNQNKKRFGKWVR